MSAIIRALEQVAIRQGLRKEWQDPAWVTFVRSGDANDLANIPVFGIRSGKLPDELLAALSLPATLDEYQTRFLQACVTSGHDHALGEWLHTCVSGKGMLWSDDFDEGCKLLLGLDAAVPFIARQVVDDVPKLISLLSQPTGAGKWLLSLDDAQLERLLHTFDEPATDAAPFGRLFAKFAERRFAAVLAGLNKHELARVPVDILIAALGVAPGTFVNTGARAFEARADGEARATLGSKLAATDPDRFKELAELAATDVLSNLGPTADRELWGQAEFYATWLLGANGVAALPLLSQYIGSGLPADRWHEFMSTEKNRVLDKAVELFGSAAIPMLDAAFAWNQPIVQMHALEHRIAFHDAVDDDAIASQLRTVLASANNAMVVRAVRAGADLKREDVEPDIWAQLSHKSKQVRDAAAISLSQLGNARLDHAPQLWASRKADTRLATVAWLKSVNTPEAAAVLSKQLDSEESANVRDAILVAVQHIAGKAGDEDPAQFRQQILKTLKKVHAPPVTWLEIEKLPRAKLLDGSDISADTVLYLLYRQSRVKEMLVDVEAAPLFAQIDRAESCDLAIAVLQAFLGSGADASGRWAMAFAGLAGDDGLIPLFVRQIKEWADGTRGKLAEYAVQALALIGTDAALVAVDAMTIRYRTKNKNIGKAASGAFEIAANARGLTVQELGDLVIPWLGFQPGQRRIVDTGKAKVEARIDSDFKLVFRDVGTNKKVAKLPSGTPVDVLTEFKEVAAGLKDAAKSQVLRMETLLVGQCRWPVDRWQQLFPRHPLLLPFAQRLVWGAYDAIGERLLTFRALEDHSLTGPDDEPCTIPAAAATIGIVHPLELAPGERARWIEHLADYKVIQPFAQLDRPVVTVSDDQRQTYFGDGVALTTLNNMSFRGRAEKLGWTRGSVADSGSVSQYVKSFPSAGVDVFVETNGMYVTLDMYSEITLGRTYFVKHGSVKRGSYVYDEPQNEQDSRLVAFGAVPIIAYSEAMGDLQTISGKMLAGENA